MSHSLDTITVGSLTVRIEPDLDPPDPRDADNLGTMICLHRRYHIGDAHDYQAEDHSDWDGLQAHILRDNPGAVLLPLYMMDHSGLTMSTTDAGFRACDPQGWDWGQVGLTFVPADAIRAEYGVRRITRGVRARVEGVLRAEVEAYDQYLRGDAYCYAIEDADGEVLDSCCGLIGFDLATSEARSAAEELVAS